MYNFMACDNFKILRIVTWNGGLNFHQEMKGDKQLENIQPSVIFDADCDYRSFIADMFIFDDENWDLQAEI